MLHQRIDGQWRRVRSHAQFEIGWARPATHQVADVRRELQQGRHLRRTQEVAAARAVRWAERTAARRSEGDPTRLAVAVTPILAAADTAAALAAADTVAALAAAALAASIVHTRGTIGGDVESHAHDVRCAESAVAVHVDDFERDGGRRAQQLDQRRSGAITTHRVRGHGKPGAVQPRTQTGDTAAERGPLIDHVRR